MVWHKQNSMESQPPLECQTWIWPTCTAPADLGSCWSTSGDASGTRICTGSHISGLCPHLTEKEKRESFTVMANMCNI